MADVILINGLKRSGKDWNASLIQEELYRNNKTSEIISIAEPIKKITADALGIDLKLQEDLKNNKEPIIVRINGSQTIISDFRTLLQRMGTEAMKPWFGENVWSDMLKKRVQDSSCDYVLVPDFRFPQEYIDGAVTLKIVNHDIINKDTHASETQLNDYEFMYEIDNTGYPCTKPQVEEFVRNVLSL